MIPSRRPRPPLSRRRRCVTLGGHLATSSPEPSVMRGHLGPHSWIQRLFPQSFAMGLSISSERCSEFHRPVSRHDSQGAAHCQPYVNLRITLVLGLVGKGPWSAQEDDVNKNPRRLFLSLNRQVA